MKLAHVLDDLLSSLPISDHEITSCDFSFNANGFSLACKVGAPKMASAGTPVPSHPPESSHWKADKDRCMNCAFFDDLGKEYSIIACGDGSMTRDIDGGGHCKKHNMKTLSKHSCSHHLHLYKARSEEARAAQAATGGDRAAPLGTMAPPQPKPLSPVSDPEAESKGHYAIERAEAGVA